MYFTNAQHSSIILFINTPFGVDNSGTLCRKGVKITHEQIRHQGHFRG